MSSFEEDMERLRMHPGVSAGELPVLEAGILALAADTGAKDDLDRLRMGLEDLEAMQPLDQARALPALIEQARALQGALARRRGAVFAGLVDDGWTIKALAKELGIGRGKIDEALAAHRAAQRG